MPSLPGPIRAAIGVVVTAVEDGRNFPERALELPVLAVSSALQLALQAQQRYAALVVKGDEFIGSLRGAPEEPPAWATFDDDAAPASPAAEPDGEPDPGDVDSLDRVDDIDDNEAVDSVVKPIKAPRKKAPSAFDTVDEQADEQPGDAES
jgi:hypothetical protein